MTNKTVIVLGCAKGGTTMTAGLCRLLGVNMGSEESMGRWAYYQEDLDLIEALRGKDETKVKLMIAERNARSTLWGVKHPDLTKRLDDLERLISYLEDPYLVTVWRDPAAIMMNRTSDQPYPGDRRLLQEMKEIVDDQHRFMKWVTENFYVLNNRPLYLSYEKALLYPDMTGLQIAEHINQPADEAFYKTAKAYVKASPGYKNIDDYISMLANERSTQENERVR